MLISAFILGLSALNASLISSMVLWKKSVYFSDSLSHSSIFAVIFSISVGANMTLGLMTFALIFSGLIWFLQSEKLKLGNVANAVATYFFVSLAIILGSESENEIDFALLMFGNLMQIDQMQIFILVALLIAILIFLKFAFQQFILAIIDRDAAKIEGVKTKFLDFSFLLILAITAVLLTKIVGILLASAMLVLPGLIARNFSKSPTQMIFFSAIIGVFLALFANLLARFFDLNLSAIMILAMSTMFFLTNFLVKSAIIPTK